MYKYKYKYKYRQSNQIDQIDQKVQLCNDDSIIAPLSGNYHGLATNPITGIQGIYFYATLQSMDSKYSALNADRFILHSTWIEDHSGKKWIENGFMDGAIQEPDGQTQYHKGYYTAQGDYTDLSTYREYKILGPSTDIGTGHAFHIQRHQGNHWGIYIDFDLKRIYSDWSISGQHPDVGLETSTLASISDEWNPRCMQIYDGKTWRDWSSGILKQGDGGSRINIAWDTSYSSMRVSKKAEFVLHDTHHLQQSETMLHANSKPLCHRPEPILKGNIHQLSKHEYRISMKREINQKALKKNNGKLELAQSMTYGDYLQLTGEDMLTEIAEDRVVFVIQVHYLDGFRHAKVGWMERCLATGLYDVVTGEYIGGRFTSD